MKILNTLVYIFAIGTAASRMAPAQIGIDLRSIMPYIANQFRQIKMDPVHFMDISVRQAVRDKCEKNGGPLAFVNATSAVRDLEKSVHSMANEIIQNDTLNSTQPQNDQDEFVKICGAIETLNTFVTRSLESIKPCFTQEERQRIDTFENMKISMTHYICENNASRLVSFWSAHGFQCVGNIKPSGIATCNRIPPPVERSSQESILDRIGLPWSVPSTYIMSMEKCRFIDSLFSCVLQQMQSCEQPSHRIASDVVNYLKEITGCNNLLEAQASAAVEVDGVRNVGSDNVKRSFNTTQDVV